jgi:DNA-binding CsgD family transcriptional regulator
VLVGRAAEQERIHAVLDAARAGRSGTLVLRGTAGIGKTALLDAAVTSSSDMTVLTARGIEQESEIGFSGLLELLRPALGNDGGLPPFQRRALEAALSFERREDENRFAVYAATLALLAATAEHGPVLVCVDDIHWLDLASTDAITFAARRLDGEGIAMLLVTRDDEDVLALEGFDELRISGLAVDESASLVLSIDPTLPPAVAAALGTVTEGNPLALVELPSLLSAQQRTGAHALDHPLPAGPALLRAFGRRVETLPDATRTALVVVAASDIHDTRTIDRALMTLSLDLPALEPAEREGLVEIVDDAVHFRHPLVRAAVYSGADPVARRHAHRALAAALVDSGTLDRRAWHRALAAVGPDDDVAAELEQAARRARSRSPQSAALAWARAARLTVDDELRVRRLLEAARDAVSAGQFAEADTAVTDALGRTDDPLVRADLEQVRARVMTANGAFGAAAELLEAAATAIAYTDPERGALMLVDASLPLVQAGDWDRAAEVTARAWELPWRRGGATELAVGVAYADALGRRGETRAAIELWRRVGGLPTGEDPKTTQLAGEALYSAGDERAHDVLVHAVALCRDRALLDLLPVSLALLGLLEARAGRLREAQAALTESYELARSLGDLSELAASAGRIAWVEGLLGNEEACREHTLEGHRLLRRSGIPRPWVQTGMGLLELSRGNHDLTIDLLEEVVRMRGGEVAGEVLTPRPIFSSLGEAYARAGRGDEIRERHALYLDEARRSGRADVLAPALRVQGLLDADETYFDEAFAWHEVWGNAFEEGLTQLAYGELLRRRKRRADARIRLRAALDAFEGVGAVLWAERARNELRASGARARHRTPDTRDDLTPQERRVAALVAEGLTNREVATRLFLSPKTIETHLGNVYRKLGVRSRTQLARVLAGVDQGSQASPPVSQPSRT